ncbi:MAG: hypothetical protein ABL933_08955 [Methyloglobulus sp.]|nr:hypothetical protein [Methyloglobulus sp.]
MNVIKLIIFFLLNIILASPTWAVTYRLKTIDVPGTDVIHLSAINNKNQVVGTAYNYLGGHAFIYSGNKLEFLDVPGNTEANDINDSGVVVGSKDGYGLIYSDGKYSTLVDPDTTFKAINNNGQAVGYRVVWAASGYDYIYPFVYSGGKLKTIKIDSYPSAAFAEAINIQGQVIVMGIRGHYSAPEFFLYRISNNHVTKIVPPWKEWGEFFPGSELYSDSINAKGQVVGTASSTGKKFGFLYSGGSFLKIEFPGAVETVATKINNVGQIIGQYQDNLGNYHGFVYNKGAYKTLDVPGSKDTELSDINTNGTIVGNYNTGIIGTKHGFIATPVTHPKNEKDCEKGGWKKFGFKNKDQCKKYVEKQGEDKEYDHEQPSGQ